jgi:hypothetical protein
LCLAKTSVSGLSHFLVHFEVVAIYLEDHVKFIDTLCGENEEILNVEECGTHWYIVIAMVDALVMASLKEVLS